MAFNRKFFATSNPAGPFSRDGCRGSKVTQELSRTCWALPSSSNFDHVKLPWNCSPWLTRLVATICMALYQEAEQLQMTVILCQFGLTRPSGQLVLLALVQSSTPLTDPVG